jgi:hypothetical protein
MKTRERGKERKKSAVLFALLVGWGWQRVPSERELRAQFVALSESPVMNHEDDNAPSLQSCNRAAKNPKNQTDGQACARCTVTSFVGITVARFKGYC